MCNFELSSLFVHGFICLMILSIWQVKNKLFEIVFDFYCDSQPFYPKSYSSLLLPLVSTKIVLQLMHLFLLHCRCKLRLAAFASV